MNPSVYQYQSATRFLIDWVQRQQEQDSQFSIRKWAKTMDVSHALVLLLVQKKRPLRIKHASFLAKGMGLTHPELLYLQALIEFEAADHDDSRRMWQMWLAENQPDIHPNVRVFDRYEILKDWIHTAILAWAFPRELEANLQQIAAKIGRGITSIQVSAALERLKSLNLIEETRPGWIKTSVTATTTIDDLPDTGVRFYQKSLLEIAKGAIDTQEVQEREFHSLSIAVGSDKLKLAKEMIRKFQNQFCMAMGTPAAEFEVYQLQLQFFRLTEQPLTRPGLSVNEGADRVQNNKPSSQTNQTKEVNV